MVVGILAVLVLIQLAVKRGVGRISDFLATELTNSGETVVLGPEEGIYRGSTAPGYPRVKGNAAVALTDERLLFRRAVGKPVEVPVSSITGARRAKAFNGAATGGRTHVIVQVPGGEVGFFVADPDAWMEALAPRP